MAKQDLTQWKEEKIVGGLVGGEIRKFQMNYRCPKSDCAGSATPLPEAMAQAMGMKCPVCQSELLADKQVVESADKTTESGPWVDWPTLPVSLPLCEYFEEKTSGSQIMGSL